LKHVEHWRLYAGVPGGENDAWIDAAVLPLAMQSASPSDDLPHAMSSS
jgi:hypothetical protein